MDFFRVKTRVVLSAAAGRAQNARARTLCRRARRITRRKLTPEQKRLLSVADSIPNRPSLGDRDVAIKRAARALRKFDPDPDRNVFLAARMRLHAQELEVRGVRSSADRRRMHLFWCYLKGRTYKECENRVRSGNEPKASHIADLVQRHAKGWGQAVRYFEMLAGLKMWLDEGELTREEVFEEIGKLEAA